MTYMYSWARDLDARNGGDAYHFSPKWTYNMLNDGVDEGMTLAGAYQVALYNGVATWEEFPVDGNHLEWSLNPAVWRNAIDRRFDQTSYLRNTNLDSGIEQVKLMLLDGYVLNIATFIYSWQSKVISDDPATTVDDPYAGKYAAYWVNGERGYHAMTVVGYNDEIWVDINSNGAPDAGEKGAFRIANSWGTYWGDAGFYWMAYDALKTISAVPGGPNSGRVTGWYPSEAISVTARSSYQPAMVAEFTVNHLKRNQLGMGLGTSDLTQTTPSTFWYPSMLRNQGGPYAFDGTTSAVDGTFVLDFTDIAPAGAAEMTRYYLRMDDSAPGDPAQLLSWKLIDVLHGNIETSGADVPKSTDWWYEYSSLDYTVNSVLAAAKSGSGNGTVISSPPGIDCGSDCSETYNTGTTVTLTATPDADSYFAGWSGDADCADGVLVMSPDKTCTATFNLLVPPYTVTSPNGGERLLNLWTTQITYTGTPGGSVTIELLKAGVLNRVITSSAPIGTDGIGSYDWLVPSMKGGSDFQIRITNTSGPETDVSDGYFSIAKYY